MSSVSTPYSRFYKSAFEGGGNDGWSSKTFGGKKSQETFGNFVNTSPVSPKAATLSKSGARSGIAKQMNRYAAKIKHYERVLGEKMASKVSGTATSALRATETQSAGSQTARNSDQQVLVAASMLRRYDAVIAAQAQQIKTLQRESQVASAPDRLSLADKRRQQNTPRWPRTDNDTSLLFEEERRQTIQKELAKERRFNLKVEELLESLPFLPSALSNGSRDDEEQHVGIKVGQLQNLRDIIKHMQEVLMAVRADNRNANDSLLTARKEIQRLRKRISQLMTETKSSRIHDADTKEEKEEVTAEEKILDHQVVLVSDNSAEMPPIDEVNKRALRTVKGFGIDPKSLRRPPPEDFENLSTEQQSWFQSTVAERSTRNSLARANKHVAGHTLQLHNPYFQCSDTAPLRGKEESDKDTGPDRDLNGQEIVRGRLLSVSEGTSSGFETKVINQFTLHTMEEVLEKVFSVDAADTRNRDSQSHVSKPAAEAKVAQDEAGAIQLLEEKEAVAKAQAIERNLASAPTSASSNSDATDYDDDGKPKRKDKADPKKMTKEFIKSIALLSKVLNWISGDPTHQKFFHNIIWDTSKMLDAESCNLWFVDEYNYQLWSKIGTHLNSEVRTKIGSGVAGSVAKNGVAANVGNLGDYDKVKSMMEKNSSLRSYTVRSILAVPIRNPRQKVIAVLEVVNKAGGAAFSNLDEMLLHIVCLHLAGVLWTTEMEAMAIKERVKTEGLFKVTYSLFSNKDVRLFLHRIIERVRLFVDAEFGVLFNYDHRTKQLLVVGESCLDNVVLRVPDSYANFDYVSVPLRSRAMVAVAARTKRVLHVENTVYDSRFNATNDEYVAEVRNSAAERKVGTRAFLILPVVDRDSGDMVGCFCVGKISDTKFRHYEVSQLSSFNDIISIALQNHKRTLQQANAIQDEVKDIDEMVTEMMKDNERVDASVALEYDDSGKEVPRPILHQIAPPRAYKSSLADEFKRMEDPYDAALNFAHYNDGGPPSVNKYAKVPSRPDSKNSSCKGSRRASAVALFNSIKDVEPVETDDLKEMLKDVMEREDTFSDEKLREITKGAQKVQDRISQIGFSLKRK